MLHFSSTLFRILIAYYGIWDALAFDMAAQCCRGLPAQLASKLNQSYFALSGVSLMDIDVVIKNHYTNDAAAEGNFGSIFFLLYLNASMLSNFDQFTCVGRFGLGYF